MPEADLSQVISGQRQDLKRLNQRNGKLSQANDALKAEVAQLKAENKTLSEKTSSLNDEGTVILSADDAKAYEQVKADLDAYKALGPLDEVKTKVESSGDAQAKLARYERRDRLAKAAAGHFNAETLAQYDPDLDVKETTVTVDEDGKQVQKTAFVVATEMGDVPFVDHIKTKHAAILPALQVSTETQPAPRQTVKIPFQGSSSSAPPVDPKEAYKKQQADKANAPTPLTKFLGAGA